MTTYIGLNADTGEASTDIDNIRQSIQKILTTLKGTRVMRREFGSIIPELIDQPFNAATRLQLMSATADAIIKHEKRIKLSSATISMGGEASAWIVDLVATVREGVLAGQTVNLSIPLAG